METPLPVILATHETLTAADLRADLVALRLPVTVVQGTVDASAPLEATGQPTVDLVADGELVTIEGGGHGLYHGHAREYSDALLAAIARSSVVRR